MVRNDVFGGWDRCKVHEFSVRASVTLCALQLARGHSNSEQVYLRMQLQATMYCCVLNRTDIAEHMTYAMEIIQYWYLADVWLVCGNRVASG